MRMNMVQIFLLTFVTSLTVGAFPALAEKQSKHKILCSEYCATKICIYGHATRTDVGCNANCEALCRERRAKKKASKYQ